MKYKILRQHPSATPYAQARKKRLPFQFEYGVVWGLKVIWMRLGFNTPSDMKEGYKFYGKCKAYVARRKRPSPPPPAAPYTQEAIRAWVDSLDLSYFPKPSFWRQVVRR